MLLFSASITARFAALLLAMAPATPAPEAPKGTEFTCPVGGERFLQDVEAPFYPLEGLPNGSSMGGQFSDRMVPICPGNGLVMVPKYDGEDGDPEAMTAYTPEEIAELPALIASPEYKALANEAAFFRLYWLATKLGRPTMQRFHLLQHVSWVGQKPEQHRANLERFLALGEPLIAAPDFDPDRRWQARLYLANALRELGRFDEAKARLETLWTEWQAEWAKRQAANPVNEHFYVDGEDGHDLFSDGIDMLLGVIADRDDDYQPVAMMGEQVANAICDNLDDGYPPVTETTKRGCLKRKLDKEEQEKLLEEQVALQGDYLELSKRCETTPKADRSEALAWACDEAEGKAMAAAEMLRRDMEAEGLLKNPKALDEQCKSVTMPQYRYASAKTGLGQACLDRSEAQLKASSKTLAAKFRKQPAEYARLCTWGYPDPSTVDPVELACGEVKSERDQARDDAERARLGKMSEDQIWAECEKQKAAEESEPGGVLAARAYSALAFRCADIRSDRDAANWEALKADPEKRAAVCAKPFQEQEEWQQDGCHRYNEELEDAAALKLAFDHDQLVASCAATPMPERTTILREACRSYLKCVVVRADELPFFETYLGGMGVPDDPAELRPACYGTVEKAAVAYARYRADPKSLRASCEPETEYASPLDKTDLQICERYARGEDVFSEDSATP